MNDDLIPGGEPPAVVAVVEPKKPDNRITCDFCGCKLAPNGDVLAMSAQARTFRDQTERIASLSKELVDLEAAHQADRAELEAARARLMAPAESAKRKGFLDDI